jgi:hypothetical protein
MDPIAEAYGQLDRLSDAYRAVPRGKRALAS